MRTHDGREPEWDLARSCNDDDGDGQWDESGETVVQSQSGMARSSASRARQIGPFDEGEEKEKSSNMFATKDGLRLMSPIMVVKASNHDVV